MTPTTTPLALFERSTGLAGETLHELTQSTVVPRAVRDLSARRAALRGRALAELATTSSGS